MKNSFDKYLPLLYVGGGLIALHLIKLIVRGNPENKETVQQIDSSVIPKSPTTNKVCKQSYSKEEVKSLFPGWTEILYDAKKPLWTDDYPAVISIIAKVRNKGDWYLLSNLFNLRYKKDLIAYLKTFLNEEEMKPIYSKIKSLKC